MRHIRKPPAARKLYGSVCHRTGVIAPLETLYLIAYATLTLNLRLTYTNLTRIGYPFETYRMSENHLPASRLSKVIVVHTYIHTSI